MCSKLNKLPLRIDPHQASKESALYKGVIDCSKMNRLQPLLQSQLNSAEVELQGGVDLYGNSYLHCKMNVALPLICQRCLQGMQYKVKVNIKLVPVNSELEDLDLPEGYEPLLTKWKSVKLSDLVEEVLLLELPVVSRHIGDECPAPLYDEVDEIIEEEQVEEQRQKPFSNLKELLNN